MQAADIARIIKVYDKLPQEDAADLLGLGYGTVNTAYRAIKSIRENDPEPLRELIDKGRGRNVCNLVAEALGYDLAAALNPPKEEPKPEAPAAPEPNPNDLLVLGELRDTMREMRDAAADLRQVLTQIQMVLQGFRKETGERLTEIKESVHIEGDILSHDIDRVQALVDAIKGHTKQMAKGGRDGS